jgi:hypothetical protein
MPQASLRSCLTPLGRSIEANHFRSYPRRAAPID